MNSKHIIRLASVIHCKHILHVHPHLAGQLSASSRDMWLSTQRERHNLRKPSSVLVFPGKHQGSETSKLPGIELMQLPFCGVPAQ